MHVKFVACGVCVCGVCVSTPGLQCQWKLTLNWEFRKWVDPTVDEERSLRWIQSRSPQHRGRHLNLAERKRALHIST